MTKDKAIKYLEIANAASKLSKDQSTKVGAAVIGETGEVRSIGYNGSPRKCNADTDGRGMERPEKYYWFSHAEANAISNAARVGIPLEGSSIVVTHPPCMDCAKLIVQSGIVQVFCPTPSDEFRSRWEEHLIRSEILFQECGVEYVWL